MSAAAFASTSSPHPATMLTIPLSSPPDPLAACDPLTLLDDSFPYVARSSSAALPHLSSAPQSHPLPLSSTHAAPPRHARPPLPSPLTAANAAAALSPRAFALSPRLPSALPPSASPRVVEPVTPDRQPLPFSADDAAVLCERAPLGTVDERAAAFIFDNVPRRSFSRPASTTAPATDAPSHQADKFNALRLHLPLDPSVTAPPPPPPAPSAPPASMSAAAAATTSAPLALDTSSAAAVAASNAASGSAQNVLSPFGLSTRPTATALAAAAAAAADNSSFLPWNKDADQPQNIVSSVAQKGASNDVATSSAFAAAAAAAAAAQVATSLSTTHRAIPSSTANASMSLSDLPLFPSPTFARSMCALTQMPDFLHAPPATSSISDMEPMQVSRPRAGAPGNRQVVSDDSPMKKSVCIPKRSIPLGVSTAASAPDPASDRLRCHMCGQRFARRSNLFKHLRSVHDDRRRFACRSCPYKFKRQDHLLKHMRSVHDRMRNFLCDICGFGFAEKFNRDKHRRSIHMTRRAFQCPCGAYFQDKEKMLKCLRCRQPSNAISSATACTNGGATTGTTF